MNVFAWKAWYRGGQSFCSNGVHFDELPDDGLLGVMIAFDEFAPNSEIRLRRQMSGSDLYWSCELLGKFTLCQGQHEDKPEKRYPGCSIKRGAWTSDEEMQRVNEDMRNWTP